MAVLPDLLCQLPASSTTAVPISSHRVLDLRHGRHELRTNLPNNGHLYLVR